MPTILQIIPHLDTGGAEESTLEITEAVTQAGGRMLVATEGGRMADGVSQRGGALVKLPVASKNPVQMVANARRLAALVRREGIDLLHARSRAPAWSALWAARMTGRPFVTTYHGAYSSSGHLKRFYNSVMARGDGVIANSHYTADLIRAEHGTPAERLAVIPRGVDLDRFDPARIAPERMAALRTTWAIGGGQRVILQAARLTGWKGQSVLIDAASRLARDGRLEDAVVVLAGDAQGREAYRDGLIAQAVAAGLGDRVKLVGHCADMPAAFALAHVTVIASTEPEAFGRATAEAMAMGCPVIATDHGAPPEILSDDELSGEGKLGWLVPPRDAGAMATALAGALMLAPDDRAALGARTQRHVTARFTKRRMQRATLGVYDRLLRTDLVAHFDAAVGAPVD